MVTGVCPGRTSGRRVIIRALPAFHGSTTNAKSWIAQFMVMYTLSGVRDIGLARGSGTVPGYEACRSRLWSSAAAARAPSGQVVPGRRCVCGPL